MGGRLTGQPDLGRPGHLVGRVLRRGHRGSSRRVVAGELHARRPASRAVGADLTAAATGPGPEEVACKCRPSGRRDGSAADHLCKEQTHEPTLDRLGRFSAGHPWRALALWAAVLTAVIGLAATLGGPAQENWDVPGARAQQGIEQLREHLPAAGNATAQVVVHDDGGRSTRAR